MPDPTPDPYRDPLPGAEPEEYVPPPDGELADAGFHPPPTNPLGPPQGAEPPRAPSYGSPSQPPPVYYAAPIPPPDQPPPMPPPESLRVNDLHEETLPELIERAAACGLRASRERSSHIIIFDLLRRLSGLGTRIEAEGIIEIAPDNCGLLRWPRFNFRPCPEDVHVSQNLLRQYRIRPGQRLGVLVRGPRDREKNLVATDIVSIEGEPAHAWQERKPFDSLTPCHPRERIVLENPVTKSVSARALDLLAPLGRGQRGLIVSPPRAGKTILLKEIARAIRAGSPEIRLLILLVDERPEEVTDFQRAVDAEIFSSTFDENAVRHVQVAELLSERAKRLVEMGKDVVILLDSITRLSRGYNNLQPGKGRLMSGGVETKALLKPKRFFSAARNCEEGGSLTILASALIDTESGMDEVIFEEFKGTGNMEVHLDRELVERRIYPAIHILKTGTRKEELLYHPDEFRRINILRKKLNQYPPMEAMERLVDAIGGTRTNAELLLTGLD